jgi:hypothetical protein
VVHHAGVKPNKQVSELIFRLLISNHLSAHVSIRQHTSAFVSIRRKTSAYVSIRQHTSAYVSMRGIAPQTSRRTHFFDSSQHSPTYRAHAAAYVSIRRQQSPGYRAHGAEAARRTIDHRPHTSAYVSSIREHTLAYVSSIREHT